MQNIDLLEVAKTLDPRFAQNMPQEVADAFANGEVMRIFRTSKDAAKIRVGSTSHIGNADPMGDYVGSIYVQLKNGKVARFKNPEASAQYGIAGTEGADAGWNAKTKGKPGRSVFFDQAHVYQSSDISDKTSAVRIAFDAKRQQNPSLAADDVIVELAREGDPIFTQTNTSNPRSIIGLEIIETDIGFQNASHQR